LQIPWPPTSRFYQASLPLNNSNNTSKKWVTLSKSRIEMSTNKNPLDIPFPDNKLTKNQQWTIHHLSRQLTIISTRRMSVEIALNSINLTGFISIGMSFDSMDTSKKALSKAIMKIQEIARSKYSSTLKIIQSLSMNKSMKTQVFLKVNSWKEKNISKMMESSWQPTISDSDKF